MNIAAYCRVSTDKEDQLNSLETQKEFFLEYAQKMGHNLVRVYADEGISGTKTRNRTEFLKMMSDAEHHWFDALVVKDISRLARNTVDLLESVRKLKSLGIDTQFLNANMTSLGDSEFVLTIFGALAQEESANMSKRVKFGKKMNAEKGRVPNLVFGYTKTIGDYFNLEINEEEAKVVRNIFQWYTQEGLGTTRIAIRLNDMGIRTSRNCKWSNNAIARILTNEIYTGRIINGKESVKDFLTGQREVKAESEWMVTEKPELRIVSQEVFEQAQAIIEGRYNDFNINRERHSNRHLFSTLIKCKNCGWSFRRVERKFSQTYVRWTCSGRNRFGVESCPNCTNIDEDELIEMVNLYLASQLQQRKDVVSYVRGEFKKMFREKDENISREKEINTSLAKLRKSVDKYREMFVAEAITMEELKEKTDGLRKEIERLENELRMLHFNMSQGDQVEYVLQQTFDEIEEISDVRDLNNTQLKRIIDKIEVDADGNVDIYLRLFSELGFGNKFSLGTSIHKDVTERLPRVNKNLAEATREVLDVNKSERHIRGGMATREKYLHKA